MAVGPEAGLGRDGQAGGGDSPPPLLQPTQAKQAKVGWRSGCRRRGSGGVVERPEARPDSSGSNKAGEGGGGVRGTAEGVMMAEEPAGMANLHVDENRQWVNTGAAFFLGVGASYSTRSYRQGYKRKPPDKEQRTEYREQSLGLGLQPVPLTVSSTQANRLPLTKELPSSQHPHEGVKGGT